MSILWQSVLAVFAAIGVYTVLHVIYELCFSKLICNHGSAELTLYGDGCDPFSEQLIRSALHIRKQYLPAMSITFVEIGRGLGKNIAKEMSSRQNISYLD